MLCIQMKDDATWDESVLHQVILSFAAENSPQMRWHLKVGLHVEAAWICA